MRATWKLLVLLIVLVFAYFIFDYIKGQKDKTRRVLFSKVRPGMTKTDVTSILGNPDTIIYENDSSAFYFEYFTKEYEGTLKSGVPSVVFDSSEKVYFTSFGD